MAPSNHKFYVGMPPQKMRTANWSKATLKEAVEHAKELCASSGEDQYVVQVVRIVRRQKPPITVEVVR